MRFFVYPKRFLVNNIPMDIFKENKRYLVATIILTFLAVVVNAFIILQSCLNGARSTESSGFVVNILKAIINSVSPNAINDGNIGTFSNLVRKLVGHFGLFVISGLFTTSSLYLWFRPQKCYKNYRLLYLSLGFGLFLAILTEIIQLFVPHRSGQFTDVLIDFSGYIVGTGIIILVAFLTYRHHKKKEIKE